MADNVLVIDCEVAPNAFGLGVKRLGDNRKVWYEFSDWEDFDRDRVRMAMKRYQTVGFNSQGFDLPIIYMALDGASNQELMDACTKIIQDRVPYWQAENEFGIRIPKIDHIDLFETNPSVKNGLKALGGRMHVMLLQELPFKPNHKLTQPEWHAGKQYCLNGDLEATHGLLDLMREPIQLRELMRTRYDTVDLRSKSDAQVGETIIKTEVERRTGEKIKRAVIAEGTRFRYEAPDWMYFKTPMMKEVFERIKTTDFIIGKSGKVEFPKEFSDFEIKFDESTFAYLNNQTSLNASVAAYADMPYTLGIGGLHSTESNRTIHCDNEYVYIDGDVASQYPNIILKLGLFPKALGPKFLPVYKSIIDARLAAKAAGDKATDKGLKIAINGSYGKLGSAYSVLFAPHLMIAVTLTGQLSLLMLIEEAHLRGISVVSGNTDGVVFKCPRSMFNGFVMKNGKPGDRLMPSPIQDLIEWWEGTTSFNLEFAEYKSIYSHSVNTYYAIKPDGSYKRKGILADHWTAELPWGGKNTDYDPIRSGLMKNPKMTICSNAVLGYLLHDIPIEKTIRECNDVRQFLTVVKAEGGSTWRDEYLGKIVRYYWSTDGDPIIKVKGHATTGTRPKVPETDGCAPLMVLPSDYAVPVDIDFERYVAEAKQILINIGHSPVVPKLKRTSPAKRLYGRVLA